jgi:acyl-CoA synthetase (AMP-forming)/AMP-acid ligase II
MNGYYGAAGRDPTVTKAVRDGWLHTGDLGRVDEDNRLYLVDRKGEMIISGGYNIYPREIEDVIAEIPEVREVAVMGISDSEWGQRVTALVTIDPNSKVEQSVIKDKILEHCKSKMASYKKPKDLRIVNEFPLNSTGKISKKLLKQQLEAEGK